jgi:hypothetical protein
MGLMEATSKAGGFVFGAWARGVVIALMPTIPAMALRDVLGRVRAFSVTITIDVVDTGERRTMGRYVARRVTTATKTEPGHGTSVPASESIQDGWYIDLPSANCWDRGDLAEPFGFTIAQRSNAPRDRVHIKRLGTARRGYPIEETSRSKDERATSTSKVELIESSDAPLDAALFTVPTGYRPALPNLFGGYDLTKPDTVMNRLQSYWHGLRAWADGRLCFVWRQ